MAATTLGMEDRSHSDIKTINHTTGKPIMDTKDLSIGILSTTAVILLTGLFIISSRPEPALASGMTAQSGEYVMTNGLIHNNEEILYVINTATEHMVAYRLNVRDGQIEVAHGPEDLKIMRERTGGRG